MTDLHTDPPPDPHAPEWASGRPPCGCVCARLVAWCGELPTDTEIDAALRAMAERRANLNGTGY